MTGLLSRIGILVAVTILPLRVAHRVAGRVGRNHYRRASPRVLDQLRAALTSRLGLGLDEAEPLMRAVFERSAVERLEGAVFRFRSKRGIGTLVEIRGLEVLNEVLAQGRGCILYSGHFRGRWSVFAKLGLLGYHPLLVRQNAPPTMSRMASWFQARFDRLFSTKFDCQFLWMESPPAVVAGTARAHLRKNGVLISLVDISSYTSHVEEVDFLNRKERFPIGPVLLSQLTGAPLLDFSIRYSPEAARYRCEFGQAHLPSKDRRQSAQELAARLDASIRSHPEDWAGWQKVQYLGG